MVRNAAFESDPGVSRTRDLWFRNGERPGAHPASHSTDSDTVRQTARRTPQQRHKGDLAARLEQYSVPEPNTGCLLWAGGLIPAGYGMIKVAGRGQMAHRVSYELNVGPIPEGLVLDHLCRVRSCIEPRHLEPVTNAENLRRGTPNRSLANSMKTRCLRGHDLEGANLYRSPDGHRHCRVCTSAAQRRHYERNRSAILAKAKTRNRSASLPYSLPDEVEG